MNRWPSVRLCLALALVGGPAGVAVGLDGEPPARQGKGPVYRGQPLGHWIKGLKGKDLGARLEAVRVLSAQAGPEAKAAVPALVAVVTDPDAVFLHAFAAHALARVGPA